MKFKLLSAVTIILALLLIIDVDAAEFRGYIYESDPIPDIYFYKHREDTEDIKYDQHNYHNRATIYRRSTDGAFVYSIESWSFIVGSGPGSYKETTNESLVNLTKEQINTIKKIAYFGYGYKDEKYDHTDKKWYAIAQYLIWQVQAPDIYHYIVDDITSNIPSTKYDDEIKELKYLATYGTNIENITLNDMFIEENTTILPPNGAGDYKIINTENINVESDYYNHSINIYPLKPGKSSLSLIDIYETFTPYKYYISDDFQDSISVGDLVMNNYTYDFNVIAGCVDVNVYEGDLNNKKLNNIEYGLYTKDNIYSNGKIKYKKDSLVQKSKSQEGKVIFDNLLKGQYYIKELSNMSKYYDDEKIIDININDSTCQEFNLYYHYQKLKIDLKNLVSKPIIKNNKIDYSFIPKSNIKFGLYNESDKLINVEKTNKQGEVKFDLSIPYGKYYIKELDIDKKYVNDFIYEFDFKRTGKMEYQVIKDIEVINRMKEGKVVMKINNNDVKYSKKVIIVDDFNEVIGEYIPDKENLITLNLPYGKYFIKELDENNQIFNTLEFTVDKEIKDVIIKSQPKEEVTNDTPGIEVETIKGEVIREPNYNYKPIEVSVGKTGKNSYIQLLFIIVSSLFLLFVGYEKKNCI